MLTLILITVTMLLLDLEGMGPMGHHLPRHLTRRDWLKEMPMLTFILVTTVKNSRKKWGPLLLLEQQRILTKMLNSVLTTHIKKLPGPQMNLNSWYVSTNTSLK